jgi:hypothetical protein
VLAHAYLQVDGSLLPAEAYQDEKAIYLSRYKNVHAFRLLPVHPQQGLDLLDIGMRESLYPRVSPQYDC